MKKTAMFAVVVLLTIGLSVSAATSPRFGVKAGLTGANQNWEYSNVLGTVNRNHRTGMAVGVFLDLTRIQGLLLRPEALYVQKGSQIDVMHVTYAGVPQGSTTLKDRIDYLSLRATARVKTSAGPLGLYFLGGPRLDLKIGTSSDIDSPDMETILNAYKSSVVGVTLGLGLEGALGAKGSLFVEACYDLDFGDAAKYVGDEATLTIDNRAVLVLVGMAF
ncbi:MAG: outer membrane beta-barrel protein [candidate division Zixibacteria bacterium]|nr:outer membrane beta-barrel protein [candidate division Zixibacteria bacterium]